MTSSHCLAGRYFKFVQTLTRTGCRILQALIGPVQGVRLFHEYVTTTNVEENTVGDFRRRDGDSFSWPHLHEGLR